MKKTILLIIAMCFCIALCIVAFFYCTINGDVWLGIINAILALIDSVCLVKMAVNAIRLYELQQPLRWRDIRTYTGASGLDLYLRVEYKHGHSEAVGYVYNGSVYIEPDDAVICKIADIGDYNIKAVYYIDPNEILK